MESNKHLNGYVEEEDDYETENRGALYYDRGVSKRTYFPTCRYCHNQTLPDAAYESQAQADEAATIRCGCEGARQYQNMLEEKRKREENIKCLKQRLSDFGEYCAGHNVELSDERYEYLVTTGTLIIDNIIGAATVKFSRIKVSISTNAKGNVVIAFTYSDGSKVEV